MSDEKGINRWQVIVRSLTIWLVLIVAEILRLSRCTPFDFSSGQRKFWNFGSGIWLHL